MSLLNLLTQSIIERWEMIIGIVGICAMGGDKLLALIGWDRISEKTLHSSPSSEASGNHLRRLSVSPQDIEEFWALAERLRASAKMRKSFCG